MMSCTAEFHADNPAQTNEPKPAEDEVTEEPPRDPLMEVSQTDNENRDTIEREEVILAINEPEVTDAVLLEHL
jgi:uncharacterized membrane protein